jgi:hypothetical protein
MLRKQELDLKEQELANNKIKMEHDFLLALASNPLYSGIILEKVKNMCSTELTTEILKEPVKPKGDITTRIPDSTLKIIESANKNNQRPQGRKLQKLDPADPSKVLTVYESMMYLLRAPENNGFKRHTLLKAITDNAIYNGFRWAFIEDGDDPNISKASPTNTTRTYNVGVILKLDETQTKILGSYTSKIDVVKELNIAKSKLNKIIDEKIKYNDCYYMYYQNCPPEILKNYTYSATRGPQIKLHPIKQINCVTGAEHIFNSFEDISVRCGIKSATIKKAILTNTVCKGYIWSYVSK